jgi:DNA-binding PucR family transcriptional regulator
LRDTVYAIVPAHRPQDAEINIETTCRAFLQRGGRQLPLLIGIGGIANDPAGLPGSRADADRALRVLRSSSDRAVARSADVEVEAMILELRDLVEASGRGPTGAYAQLLAYDRERNASMIETLRAWLNAHGDVITAAAASHVHQNTFRYRLRRLSEIAEVDLDDPQARFALELQLRIFPPDSPRT